MGRGWRESALEGRQWWKTRLMRKSPGHEEPIHPSVGHQKALEEVVRYTTSPPIKLQQKCSCLKSGIASRRIVTSSSNCTSKKGRRGREEKKVLVPTTSFHSPSYAKQKKRAKSNSLCAVRSSHPRETRKNRNPRRRREEGLQQGTQATESGEATLEQKRKRKEKKRDQIVLAKTAEEKKKKKRKYPDHPIPTTPPQTSIPPPSPTLLQLPNLRHKTSRIPRPLLLSRGSLPRIRTPRNNLGNNLPQQILRHEDRARLRIRIQPRTFLERGFQGGGDDGVADAAVRERDAVRRVRDGHDAGDLVGDVREGRSAVGHLGPALVVFPAADLAWLGLVRVGDAFRGHVVGGADVAVAVDVAGVVCVDGVGDAEVDEFKPALHDEEIGGFEVRVHDVVVVYGLHAFEHFFPVVAGGDGVEFGVDAVESQGEESVEICVALLHEDQELLLVFIQLPIEESDDPLDFCQLSEKIDLALIPYDGSLIAIV
ncbi:kinase-like protein [Hortaea werneckii]|nr:kinase-like protein [Hortaea werneckii]